MVTYTLGEDLVRERVVPPETTVKRDGGRSGAWGLLH